MRTMLATAIVGTAMLITAGSAGAKVPAEVYVSGGDLEDELTITGGNAVQWPEMSGLVDGAEIAAPTGDLGPRYTVLFITYAHQERETVQHLYPFAQGGPAIYTPAGQRWATGAIGAAPEGWTRADPSLMQMLEAKGLPAEPPATSAAPTAVAEPGSVVWAIGLIGGMLLGAAFLFRPPRRVASRSR